MYRHYSAEDRLHVAEECAERVKSILRKRYDELEEIRDAINDRYPFEDLYLKYDEVDYEEALIRLLLGYLENDKKAICEHEKSK